jgi:tripartite-type tricarboxylate transporter receptor subunit TctC
MKRRTVLKATAAAVMASTAAQAQAWPNRPITLFVPFAAGGPSDMFGRILARGLSAELGQQVVVENKGGMGGLVGVAAIAKAAPDGYAIGMNATGPSAIAPFMVPNMPFEDKDLALLTPIALVQMIVAVSSRLPVSSVAELIAYAKANPGKINYGSSGPGGISHLAAELFRSAASIDIVHVPYRGAVFTDVIGGRVTMTLQNMGSILPVVRQGQLRGLAVTSASRTPIMPDLPTLAESGLPGFEAISWFGLLAPAGTPPAVIAKLHQEAVRIVSHPDMREKLGLIGLDVVGDAPDAFAEIIRTDTLKWAKVIKEAGIKAE